jgi:phage shock protein C
VHGRVGAMRTLRTGRTPGAERRLVPDHIDAVFALGVPVQLLCLNVIECYAVVTGFLPAGFPPQTVGVKVVVAGAVVAIEIVMTSSLLSSAWWGPATALMAYTRANRALVRQVRRSLATIGFPTTPDSSRLGPLPEHQPAQNDPATVPEQPDDDQGGAGNEEVAMKDDERGGELVAEQSLRRLRRSHHDRVLAGVCGGLGEYLGVDPVLLRLAAVALTVSGGAGVLIYVIAWLFISESDREDPRVPAPPVSRRASAAIGVGLVVLSLVLLLGPQPLWADAAVVWVLAAVALGTLYLATRR